MAKKRPDGFLDAAPASAAETIGKVIIAADAVLAASRPDALLVLGDTNSCLAIIVAKRRKTPIFHMESRESLLTADINLTYSDAHSHASLPVTHSTSWTEVTA